MPDILTKQEGPVLHITINQPDRGNAVTDDMVRELTRLIQEAPKTSDIVVLRGAGQDFCVGRAGMGARPEIEPTAFARRNFSDVVFDAYGTMRNCPIPIIAVVQGGAHGFGGAIAAACTRHQARQRHCGTILGAEWRPDRDARAFMMSPYRDGDCLAAAATVSQPSIRFASSPKRRPPVLWHRLARWLSACGIIRRSHPQGRDSRASFR